LIACIRRLTMVEHLRTHILPATFYWLSRQPPWLRAIFAVIYVTALTLLLAQSSQNPVIGPAAPEEFNLAWEILLVCGHVAGFAGLVTTCWWALLPLSTAPRAVVAALLFALALGFVTETLQSLVPDRSASLFDLIVNWGVSAATAYYLQTSPVIQQQFIHPQTGERSTNGTE
jgi:VanZ family protein